MWMVGVCRGLYPASICHNIHKKIKQNDSQVYFPFQISTNGYLALGEYYNSFSPQSLQSFRYRLPGIICPFWADSVAAGRDEESVVYYKTSTKHLTDSSYNSVPETDREWFRTVDQHIQESMGYYDFQARWILKVTWKNLKPFAAGINSQQVSDLPDYK